MTTEDKRTEERIVSHNLLYYECMDEKGEVVMQGMGRTLDVSEGGILLETHVPLDTFERISFTISLEDFLLDINGKVKYTKESGKGKYESGIKFLEMDEKKIRIIKQYAVIFKGEILDQ